MKLRGCREPLWLTSKAHSAVHNEVSSAVSKEPGFGEGLIELGGALVHRGMRRQGYSLCSLEKGVFCIYLCMLG